MKKKDERVSAVDQSAALYKAIRRAVFDHGGSEEDFSRCIGDQRCVDAMARKAVGGWWDWMHQSSGDIQIPVRLYQEMPWGKLCNLANINIADNTPEFTVRNEPELKKWLKRIGAGNGIGFYTLKRPSNYSWNNIAATLRATDVSQATHTELVQVVNQSSGTDRLPERVKIIALGSQTTHGALNPTFPIAWKKSRHSSIFSAISPSTENHAFDSNVFILERVRI